MKSATGANGKENTQPTGDSECVVEIGDDSNGSTAPTDKKISTKDQLKTSVAIRKSQKVKQKGNIEQKMLALLSEDRDRGG